MPPAVRSPTPPAWRCHVKNTPHFDLFTPWAKSGHAEIFTQNVTTPAGHYTSACVSCHTVGFNAKAVKNNGIDEASDWQASWPPTCSRTALRTNWTKTLANYPATARMANIQCENCHGPQDSAGAHEEGRLAQDALVRGVRNLSRRTGASRPLPAVAVLRHANYEDAIAEGTDRDVREMP